MPGGPTRPWSNSNSPSLHQDQCDSDSCVCCESQDLESSPALWMPFVSDMAMGLAPLRIDKSLGLVTVPDGTAYALCKSLMCRQCGHLFVDYRFSDSEMHSLYSNYRGPVYTELRDSYEPGYKERNAKISEGVPFLKEVEEFLEVFVPESGIAVLDWGGDTGINSPFRDRRSLLHIYDPSAKEAGRSDAVSFSEIPEERVQYDLIVLSEVLEHIPFPADTLCAIRPFLTPQTILYVEVPLERLQVGQSGPPYSGAERKKHWHEHINFFTPRSMELLLERSGFSIAASKIFDFSGSQTEALGSSGNLLQYACRRTNFDN